MMGKGPYLFGANLKLGCVVFKFLASNQTLSPSWYGWKRGESLYNAWACVIAAWAARRASWIHSSRSFVPGTFIVRWGWCTLGVDPKINSFGVFFFVGL